MPGQTQVLLHKIFPFPVKRLIGHGAQLVPVFKILVVMALMLAVLTTIVSSQVGIIQDVTRVMCDGNQAFLAVQLASGPVVAGAANPGENGSRQLQHRAILQPTDLDPTHNRSDLIFYDGEPYSLGTVDELLVYGKHALA